jgi:hypothetical protein
MNFQQAFFDELEKIAADTLGPGEVARFLDLRKKSRERGRRAAKFIAKARSAPLGRPGQPVIIRGGAYDELAAKWSMDEGRAYRGGARKVLGIAGERAVAPAGSNLPTVGTSASGKPMVEKWRLPRKQQGQMGMESAISSRQPGHFLSLQHKLPGPATGFDRTKASLVTSSGNPFTPSTTSKRLKSKLTGMSNMPWRGSRGVFKGMRT